MTLHRKPAAIVKLAGIPVRAMTAAQLATRLWRTIPARKGTALFFANTNLIVQCQGLVPALNADDVIVVNDGVGLALAARIFYRARFPENLNGTDFTPLLLRRASRPLRIFMIGGKADILQRAVEHVRVVLKQDVVGALDGYQPLDTREVIERISRLDVDVVLVALGNPLQERWIIEHRASTRAGVLIGVGALFDFWAGAKPRAPDWIRRLRLEWLFRLSLEPRRLLRRYTLDIARFMLLCHVKR